jgi:hypothetical protein
MTMTEIDPDLIERLDEALDAARGSDPESYLELLTAATLVVESAKSAPDAEAYEDRDGDVWVRWPSGEYRLDDPDGHTLSLNHIQKKYGPLKLVRR